MSEKNDVLMNAYFKGGMTQLLLRAVLVAALIVLVVSITTNDHNSDDPAAAVAANGATVALEAGELEAPTSLSQANELGLETDQTLAADELAGLLSQGATFGANVEPSIIVERIPAPATADFQPLVGTEFCITYNTAEYRVLANPMGEQGIFMDAPLSLCDGGPTEDDLLLFMARYGDECRDVARMITTHTLRFDEQMLEKYGDAGVGLTAGFDFATFTEPMVLCAPPAPVDIQDLVDDLERSDIS